MTLDEQIKEAEQKLAQLKAEKERLKLDIDISDCWPAFGDRYISLYGNQSVYVPEVIGSNMEKPMDICFRDEAQRQRAIRWHKIDKLWKHLAAESHKLAKADEKIVFKRGTEWKGHPIDICCNWVSLPKTYDFKTQAAAFAAIYRIGQENLLF